MDRIDIVTRQQEEEFELNIAKTTTHIRIL